MATRRRVESVVCISNGSYLISVMESGKLFLYDALSKIRHQPTIYKPLCNTYSELVCVTENHIFVSCEEEDTSVNKCKAPFKLTVYGKTEREPMVSVSLKDTATRLIANVGYVCAVSDTAINIMAAKSLQFLKRQETFLNPGGCCAISTESTRTMICCLGLQRGTIRFERISNSAFEKPAVIAAHESPLVAIGLSGDGAFVSTASESGASIRVHATTGNCDLVFEIRKTCRVASLFMSFTGSFLGCLDDTGASVSVFKSAIISQSDRSAQLLEKSLENTSFVGSKLLLMMQPIFNSPLHAVAAIPPRLASGNSRIEAVAFGPAEGTLVVASDTYGMIFHFDVEKRESIHLNQCGLLRQEGEATGAEDDWVLLPVSS